MNFIISFAFPVTSLIHYVLCSISSKMRYQLWTMQGVQKKWLYWLSTINPATLQTNALSMTTSIALFGPTCSVADSITYVMKLLSFISPDQLSALKNIAPAGEDAMRLTNDLRLVSVQSFETMVTTELLHVFQIGFKMSSIRNLSFLSKIVLIFS